MPVSIWRRTDGVNWGGKDEFEGEGEGEGEQRTTSNGRPLDKLGAGDEDHDEDELRSYELDTGVRGALCCRPSAAMGMEAGA